MRHCIGSALLAASVLALAGQGALAADEGRFFTVEQRDGAWWFITPDNKPFFSVGVNVLGPGPDKKSYDPARPQYAAWRHYSDLDAWANATLTRLRDWNFNTIGGWHDERLRRDDWPYTEVLHMGVELGAPWNDLFHESFAEGVDRFAAKEVAPHRDDAQLVGWFTDNELGWYSDALFLYHLNQPAESKTRQRLVRQLRDYYRGDFAKLRSDFEPQPDTNSFEGLERGGALKLIPGGRGPRLVAEFVEALANQYYSVVCAAIRKHDPNHLILGDRYPGYCPDPVVRAAGRHLDVISTNYDWPAGVDGYLPRSYLQRIHMLTGKPVIVTEYYSAAEENQSGNPNSGKIFVVTPNQKSRAAVVQRRLRTFAGEPYVVGAHWFAFADEPPQGRAGDGEDYNFGLVDIHNRPYEMLTAGMKEWHAETAIRHASSGWRESGDTKAPIEINESADGLAIDAVISALNSQTVVPSSDDGALAELTATWDATHLYLTLAGNHFVEAKAYAEQSVPLSEGQAWKATIVRDGKASSFELQMLGERCEATEPSVGHHYSQRGVRFSATAAIPARLLEVENWKPGDLVALRAELCDRRENCGAEWDLKLKLSRKRDRESQPAETASLAP